MPLVESDVCIVPRTVEAPDQTTKDTVFDSQEVPTGALRYKFIVLVDLHNLHVFRFVIAFDEPAKNILRRKDAVLVFLHEDPDAIDEMAFPLILCGGDLYEPREEADLKTDRYLRWRY